MNNPVKGTVTREISGKTLTLQLSMNEWCDLEDELGKSTDEILASFQAMADANRIEMKFLRTVFRAAMSSAHPEITHHEAGDIAASMGLKETAALLGEVIIASMPDGEEDGDAATKKPNRATRRRAAKSGASG